MLLVSACADRSHAPPVTSEIETWRLWLGIACALLVVVWVALLGLIGVGLGPTSTDALGNLVTGVVFVCISCLMPFTFAGQFADWLTTSIYGWGTIGVVALFLLSALGGTQGMKGVPVAWVTMYGFVYPREELLTLLAVPALVVQLPALAWVAWAGMRARMSR
jgi:hypothetical protein